MSYQERERGPEPDALGNPDDKTTLTQSVDTKRNDGVVITAQAYYSRDQCGILVATDVCNSTTRKLTIKKVRLALENIERDLVPETIFDGTEVPGYDWQGPGVSEPVPPDEVRQWAWYFPVTDSNLRTELEIGARQATLFVEVFPFSTIQTNIVLSLAWR